MKFGVIARTKDTFLMLPPERQWEVIEASTAYTDKLLRAGTLKENYNMPGLKGSFAILECESAEEADQVALQWPFYPFADVEIYVLSEWDAFLKTQKGLYQQILAKK